MQSVRQNLYSLVQFLLDPLGLDLHQLLSLLHALHQLTHVT
jgi:hypothetical protein